MTQESLTSEHTEWLVQQQAVLQTEAEEVIKELQLVPLLQQAGQLRHLGSSALGLMVWRDIDLSVSCPSDIELPYLLKACMFPLFCHPFVERIRFLNQTDLFCEKVDDARYYFAVEYHPFQRAKWKIDLSFWTNTAEHLEPIHDGLMAKLTQENRLLILWIKEIWYRLPSYRTQVYSIDIYDAVLNHNVQTPGEFESYLQARGKPGRG